MTGLVEAICVSQDKGTAKKPVEQATFVVDYGVQGDAHAGDWHRQVSLLAAEEVAVWRERLPDLGPGDFAENITTEGIDLLTLHLGGRLRLGESVELEITQFGKKCHSDCEIFRQVGDCVMPREGIFARVIKPGRISVGDIIEVVDD